MAYVWGALFLVSVVMHIVRIRKTKERNANLRYICGKLDGIISDQTAERLLLVTAEPELRDLLIGVNRLLAYNHEVVSDGNRTKLSMRRMLSNVSHDLKTPLAVILGYIETIRLNRELPAEEREALLVHVQMKAVEVSDLINQFFNLAKLESGDWQIRRRAVLLDEVCRKSILGYYDILTSKGFDVNIEIPEEPVTIYADEEALSRILDNLISNAIRYGDEGRTVGLKLSHDDSHAYMEVWDRGRGIAETDKERIFERLYTLEDSRSTSTKGSGLGLTIVKRLTEQMEGTVEVSSEPYVRTVFTVRFAMLSYGGRPSLAP
ncbi:sensor histidine kinase [Gorillibacterium sp. sgz5001074]|uniref:sensor histidine kinase n=1 Tax=Gorillibacterium sp. sgz5001074 TaxID=3446695 RepID=UPI003F668903